MDYIGIIIGLAVGVILTIVLVKSFANNKEGEKINLTDFESEIRKLTESVQKLNIEKAKLESNIVSVTQQKEKLEQKLGEVNNLYQTTLTESASLKTRTETLEKVNQEFRALKTELQDQKNILQKEASQLSSKVAALEEINKNLNAQNKEISNVEERFNKEFENIAGRLIKSNAEAINKKSSDSLHHILDPLKEDLERFKKNIDDKYVAEAEAKASLKTEIQSLVKLNEQLSDEANNLTKALTGNNKHQGNWGEIVLERVLERSGLNKGSEYKLQENIITEDGSRRIPDAVVFLPDDKHIIIDSKVTLIAYQRMVNSETIEEETAELKKHVVSLKSHIKDLSSKSYYDTEEYNSPDFTLLFLPIEASFSVALKEDPELFNYAWERNIVIVSPTTLLATLRTIESTWKHERQTRNVLEIARVGGTLYDKFVGFVDDLKKIEKGIKSSQTAYDSALNKLQTGNGNIIRQSERLKVLGAKAKKSLPSELLENQIEINIETPTDEI